MSTASHPTDPEDVMAYLDGELSLDRAAAAAAHLERCPECRAIAADIQSASQALMAWQVESPGPLIPLALEVALEQWTPKRRSWLSWTWAFAAAALVLVLFVGFEARRRAIRMEQATGLAAIDEAIGTDGQLQPDNNAASARKFRSGAPAVAADQISLPRIVRTAALNLVTPEFDKTRAAVEDILKRHQGYLASMNISAPEASSRTMNAVLRVPTPELEAAIAELKKLGRVESEQRSGEEVTRQYVDLEARLANGRHTEQRLTDLLRQQNGKLSDVLAVEVQIDRVRGEIEQMEAELKSLANRVDFATLNITLMEDYKARLQVLPDSTPARFRNAAVEGYQTMVAGIISVALFLITAAPTMLLLLGVLFFPARYAWRKRNLRLGSRL